MNRNSGSPMQQPLPGNPMPRQTQNRSQPIYPALPIPAGQTNGQGTRDRNGSLIGGQQYDTGKSPPNLSSKNTKHVPCKFFRQGQCQAGNACPFLHTLDPMSQQAPCKYFMKGNCKFGAKCALAHYLPNGHRVSKADLDSAMKMNPRNYIREDVQAYPSPDPALNEAFLPSQGIPDYFRAGQDMQFLYDDEGDLYQDRYQQRNSNGNHFEGIGSPPTSQFGSPPDNMLFHSPADRVRPSALNAPLPASYDPTIPPHIAKFGPFGQSVPDKFGLRSLTNSVPSQNLGSPPSRDPPAQIGGKTSNLKNATNIGVSPAQAGNSIGERMMHSQRVVRPKIMSASVPVHDWTDDGLGIEPDLLPSGLHEDVLTPQERTRRLSRPDQDTTANSRDTSEGLAIPRRQSNQFGSPPASGSPSRFRAIFEEQQREKSNSVSGQVGSPLRESWLADGGSSLSARPLQISGITQAMNRMELNRSDSIESNGPRISGLRAGYARFDRQISSPGLHSRRIDEEGEGAFFPMDDESTRRANPAWIEAQNANSRKVSEESNTTQNRGGASIQGNRPIFGFQA